MPNDLTDRKRPARSITINTTGTRFLIAFPFDQALNARVKEFPGCEFDRLHKAWSIPIWPPLIADILKFAQRHGLIISSTAHQRLAELARPGGHPLHDRLLPFQREGVLYALRARRTFLADEMGLGKTVQALATLELANAYPAIIVCPNSLKANWQREIAQWLPHRSIAVWTDRAQTAADFAIIHYEAVDNYRAALHALKSRGVVFDEAHLLRNQNALRTRVCFQLAQGVPYRLMLTGIPVLNRPAELISPLRILDRLNDLGGFKAFTQRYCRARRDRLGLDLSGADHLSELNERLRSICYLRRTKADVLPELPPKRQTVTWLWLNPAANYFTAERNLIAWLHAQLEADPVFLAELASLPPNEQAAVKAQRLLQITRAVQNSEPLKRIEELKQVCARSKLGAITTWLTEQLAASNEKWVVFAWHQTMIDALGQVLSAATLTGQLSVTQRQAVLDRFQTDPTCRVLVTNLKTGGVGHNLTAASQVLFVELDWSPAEHDQAEDRCHRIGQTRPVQVTYLLARDTLEVALYEMLEKKRRIVSEATDGKVHALHDVLRYLLQKG